MCYIINMFTRAQSVRHSSDVDQVFSNIGNRVADKHNPLLLRDSSNRYSHYVNYEEIQQHLK